MIPLSGQNRRKYFSNIFISIVPEVGSYRVFYKVLKNGKLKAKSDKIFEVKLSEEELNQEIEKYIISLQEEHNFDYVALYLDSMGQGAINAVENSQFKKFNVDINHIYSVKFKEWSAYVSYIDINWIKKIYKNVGLDFIYSPFVITYFLLKQHKLREKPTLYMLNLKDSFSLSVFKEETLLFGAFFKLNKEDVIDIGSVENWENEEEESGVEEFVNLEEETPNEDESLNLDDLENLEDLEEQDIESIESINDATIKNLSNEEDKNNEEDTEPSIEDISLYGRDMELYRYMQAALREYYSNPIYDSHFIEDIIIFDSYEMSEEIINSMENELLLNLQMHKIDIAEVICDMSIKEAFK